MPEVLPQHNESLMPIPMGPSCRVPDYAYPDWRQHPYRPFIDGPMSEAAYQAEWAAGNAGQLALVSQATIQAGFGDFPELLRQAAASAVREVIQDSHFTNLIRILDIGAGPGLSALATHVKLPNRLREKTTFALLEPSFSSLLTAADLMEKHDIKYQPYYGIDLRELGFMKPNSVDIVTAVASIHHHAKIPFEKYYDVLKPGGYLVIADWHHPIWEHPYRVFRFLANFDWPKKEKGLMNWLDTYPEAWQVPPVVENPADRQAIEQITKFWLAYKEITEAAALGPNAILPLEGHRPVERYVGAMKKAGFHLESSPRQLLPDSSLLMLTVGQKAA